VSDRIAAIDGRPRRRRIVTSENIGEKEDLALNEEDADKVVGGVKKKKKATTHKAAPSQIGPYRTGSGGEVDPDTPYLTPGH
jgi:hypothetical protein